MAHEILNEVFINNRKKFMNKEQLRLVCRMNLMSLMLHLGLLMKINM